MSFDKTIRFNYKYRRQVIQYDPVIGYRFIPNLYARIKHANNSYVIQTNDQGFRDNESFDKRVNNRLNILALGDSYLAGDGISNNERFMNLIAESLDINVLNMGLPGSGTDQQLVIQEKIASKWDYDILTIVPFLHNLNRNQKSNMYVLDFSSRKPVDIRKPYFELLNGSELVLKNSPVPKSPGYYLVPENNSNGYDKNIVAGLKRKLRRNVPFVHQYLNRAKGSLYDFAYQRNLLKADPDFANSDSHGWKLMKTIFNRMIDNAGSRAVVIIPIPFAVHVQSSAYPHYLDRFNELAGPNVTIIDILPAFKKLSGTEKETLFIPDDGHYTAKANKLIADTCMPIFSELTKKGHSKKNVVKSKVSATPIKSKYVLGVSCFYHDSAAAIIKDGRIVAAAQEERFSRIKHDKSFPVNAINYCLEEVRINGNDLSAVVYYDNEYLTLERMIATQFYVRKKSRKLLKNSLSNWVATKFNVWTHIRNEVEYSGPLYRSVHHRSHTASAFYPSPFEEAAIITVDGVGEWSTTTIGVGTGREIKILKEQRFPHSLGLLYSAFTSFCGFKVNSGEYKLMGLAPYGQPNYIDRILEHLIEVVEDGSFKLNLQYFSFLEGETMTNKDFANLFDGPPRRGETEITTRECDLACSIQQVIEMIMMRIVQHVHTLTGKSNLVLAGGVALNCVANGRILREGPFKNVWIQPAAGDAGGAVGAALDLWYGTWANTREKGVTDQCDSCFGPAFSAAEVKAFLDFHNYKYHELSDENRACVISDYLLNDKIVGHFSGKMEYGPRALGARSIIADARSVEMQKTLNLKIKYRESFRPFAPIVLEEKISDYFQMNTPSPYMLLVAPVSNDIKKEVTDMGGADVLKRLKNKRSSIPAVTHIDYSARIQSVSKERYPELYAILKHFEQKSGCGVLVNTSFNVRGEPIVCSPEDAYRCFMRTEMDVLVINNFLLLKEEQQKLEEEKDWRLEYELD